MMSQGKGSRLRGREWLAGIAATISLIFVGFEVRQNTLAIRGQTLQELSTSHSETLLAGAEASLAASIAKWWDDEELTSTENWQVSLWLLASLQRLENVYSQWQQGLVDDSAMNTYGWGAANVWGTPQFERWFIPSRRAQFNDGFVAAFDERFGLTVPASSPTNDD